MSLSITNCIDRLIFSILLFIGFALSIVGIINVIIHIPIFCIITIVKVFRVIMYTTPIFEKKLMSQRKNNDDVDVNQQWILLVVLLIKLNRGSTEE